VDSTVTSLPHTYEGKHLQDQVMQINAELGNTVMMITHDVEEAVLLSDRTDGRVAGRSRLREPRGLGESSYCGVRYLPNQARIALTRAADCDGRAAKPPCEAPGTLTSAVGTPLSCNAW
jgi:hypothetical protein